MIQITQDDVKKYIKAQEVKKARCEVYGIMLNQNNKYGLYRWKASGLPIEKYLRSLIMKKNM